MKLIHRIFETMAIIAFCCQVFACERCSNGDNFPALVKIQGKVERDWADRVSAWQPAKLGTRFHAGDGVRTLDKSSAILELRTGSSVRILSRTTIRFSRSTARTARQYLHVQMGEAEVVAGDQPVVFILGIGLATLNPGSRMQIRQNSKGFEYLVKVGTATFQDNKGQLTELSANQGVRIHIGDAVFQIYDLNKSSLTRSNQASLEKTSAETGIIEIKQQNKTHALHPEEQYTISERDSLDNINDGPSVADLWVVAGESFTVHVSRPPIVVEFRFAERCPEGAVVRRLGVKPERSRGDKSANLLFQAGASRYAIHCMVSGSIQNKPKVSGTVFVIRDSGTAALPRNAPSSLVDIDGRYYNILYQNLLPAVTVRWPKPYPEAKSYLLQVVSPSNKTKTVTTEKPEYIFVTGSLGEGIHEIQFKTFDGLASKSTRVEIRFNNAAPTASLREPKEAVFKTGDEVSVSGVAVSGCKISLQGGALSVDANYRFSGKVVYTDMYRAVTIRLAHAKTGIHYYLRRSVEGFR